MITLEIYVDPACRVCRRSLVLGDEIRDSFPEVRVKVIELGQELGAHESLVTATPTFVLDGVVLALGNPTRVQLERAIRGLREAGA